MAFNRLKRHPLVAPLLAGGTLVRYGAKALPEGGWNTIPQPYMDGGLIAGDAGGFLNSMRLKGIHLAMRTGMLAAERRSRRSARATPRRRRWRATSDEIDAGPVRAELYPVRNVHQAFGHGLLAGPGVLGALAARPAADGSRICTATPGHERMQTAGGTTASTHARHAPSNATPSTASTTFDKVTNVHYSGTAHDEDQPSHLLVQTEVCATICGPEYGHPCTRFCPAHVYEIVARRRAARRGCRSTPRTACTARRATSWTRIR